MKPSYTVLAGPNGAGKSTFYETFSLLGFRTGKFVNPDVIATGLRQEGNVSEKLIDYHAGRETLRTVADCVKNQVDFMRETTLSGHEILRSMERAQAAGYEVNLVYIGLDEVELSVNRVATRVACGGHDIPAEAIRRRYEKSIRNAGRACRLADNVIFYDNSSDNGYYPLAQIRSGRLSWFSFRRSGWLNKLLGEWVPLV